MRLILASVLVVITAWVFGLTIPQSLVVSACFGFVCGLHRPRKRVTPPTASTTESTVVEALAHSAATSDLADAATQRQ